MKASWRWIFYRGSPQQDDLATLQFVLFNGAIVGGLAGLALYTGEILCSLPDDGLVALLAEPHPSVSAFDLPGANKF
jgi:hypothetical protein